MCFILGNCPELSLAELASVLQGMRISFDVIGQGDDSVELRLSKNVDAKELMTMLGGCIKIGSWTKDIPAHALSPALLSEYLATERPNKLTYGISVSSVSHVPKNKRISAPQLKRLALSIKKGLKQQGIASRCVLPSDGSVMLSSVQSEKNNLTKPGGIELFVVCHPGSFRLYTISAVQPFEDWSFRDYGRPRRSMSIGMLPPKIARMMVNISQSPFSANTSLLDPFCGTGTILQEGLLSGISNITGSDISNAAIASSRENLIWLRTNHPSIARVQPSLHICDATNLQDCFSKKIFSTIVTEVYLGPIIHGAASLPQKEVAGLEFLYTAFFRSCARLLIPQGLVVIALPYWPSSKSAPSFLPSILSSIEHLGFKNITRALLAPFATQPQKRNSILFSREGQSVGREICVFMLRT